MAYEGGYGTLEKTRQAAAHLEIILRDVVSQSALELGWADQATLDSMRIEIQAWGERPDAFLALLGCQMVGWVGETEQRGV